MRCSPYIVIICIANSIGGKKTNLPYQGMFDRLQALKRETIGLLDRFASWYLIFMNRYIIKGSLQKLFGIFFL